MTIEIKYSLSILGGILLSCFTAYLGYKTGIKSEKRKEFNAIADQLRFQVRNLFENLSNENQRPMWPKASDFILLTDIVTGKEKQSLVKAINMYKNSCEKSCGFTQNGIFEIWDENDIKKSLKALLKSLKRK